MTILLDQCITVKEVAAQCGFYDENYFCRLFRKRFGISPGKYKEKEGIRQKKDE
jgi:AraC-like DNA-binding protein